MERPNRITVKERTFADYTVRLAREITRADDFDEEFALLSGVSAGDSVKFLITSVGGSVDTCNLLTKAIRESHAYTIAYIGSTCASAATAIALSCDEWEIDSQSSFMIHTGSFGAFGKVPEIEVEIKHRGMMVSRWVRDTYEGFLTEEEIERVIDGKDYYFEGEELAERLTAYGEYRDAIRQANELDTEEEAA